MRRRTPWNFRKTTLLGHNTKVGEEGAPWKRASSGASKRGRRGRAERVDAPGPLPSILTAPTGHRADPVWQGPRCKFLLHPKRQSLFPVY